MTRRCVAVSGGRQNASLEGRRRSRSSRGWLREATLVVRTFEDLVETVRAIARLFKTDKVFMLTLAVTKENDILVAA